MTVPEVTVVIPTRNRWDLLPRRALRAALMQEDVDFEVVVVDDASDRPAPPLPELQDPRVRLVRHEVNRGVGAARNTGIAAARANWVAFIDDDDMWSPRKLRTLLDVSRAAGADFAYSSVLVVYDDLAPILVTPAPDPATVREQLQRSNVVAAGGSTVMATSEILAAVGGFDPSYDVAADWDLWKRLAAHGRAAASDEVLVAYRQGTWIVNDIEAHRREFAALYTDGDEPDWRNFEQYVGISLHRAGQRKAAARHYARAFVRHRDPRSLVRIGTALLGPQLARRLRRRRIPPAPDWLARYAA